MGAIKVISDQIILDNNKELITPAIVRQVNDVIDAQVEEAKGSITTLEQNVTTLGSGVIPNGGTTGQVLAKSSNTDRDTAWVASGVPNGGTTGQVLAKKTNTDKDTEWVDAGGGFLPLAGGTMTGSVNMNGQEITNLENISVTNKASCNILADSSGSDVFNVGNKKFVVKVDYENNGTDLVGIILGDFSLVHKKHVETRINAQGFATTVYVDTKTANVPTLYKETFTTGTTGTGNTDHDITHSLNGLDLVISLWQGEYCIYQGLAIGSQIVSWKTTSVNGLKFLNLAEDTEYRIIITAY